MSTNHILYASNPYVAGNFDQKDSRVHRNGHINNYTGRTRRTFLESGSHENDCAVGRPPTLNHQSTAGIASDVNISALEEHDLRKRCECLINSQAYSVGCDDNHQYEAQ